MIIHNRIAGLDIGDKHPVRTMGVINLSRESFYKGSITSPEPDSMLQKAWNMIDEGADIIDIGARSTWPLAPVISIEEEKTRIKSALKGIADNINVPVSIDTMYHEIADVALSCGADIINDVSGLVNDPMMINTAIDHDCPVIVMATDRIPGDPIGTDAIIVSLERIITNAEHKGIRGQNLIIDPAIGKWVSEKQPMHDFETIDNLARLRVLGKPILAAISRKSCIGEILGKPATERLYGSLAATAIAVRNGAHIIRTHDVAETIDTIRIAEAIKRRPVVVSESGFEMELVDIGIQKPDDAMRYMRTIGVTAAGSSVMKNKTRTIILHVKNITTTEALIIKQEMLARGGDAALPRDAVSHETEHVDAIVIGTVLQVSRLVAKLKGQARNLPIIANMVQQVLDNIDNVDVRYKL